MVKFNGTRHNPAPLAMIDHWKPSELANLALLREAIVDRRTVNFMYDGKIRVVEVHAIGASIKNAELVMRGYQVALPVPQWRLFSVDKIEVLSFGKEASRAPAPGYREGDSQMGQILCEIIL